MRSVRCIILGLIASLSVLMLAACICPYPASSRDGTLEVDIDYTGTWYRETFDYAREAPNIRHVVLVVPDSPLTDTGPGWIFTSLEPLEQGFAIRADRQEYAWGLDYLYLAPAGRFSGSFAPGIYHVAAAFLAAPLTREQAGVSEDTILWPGVTGGGASTVYQTIVIEAGTTTSLTIRIGDEHGWG